jgi:hypothetical protein
VAAKSKKHKKRDKQPQFTTVTRTKRQPVTQTFTSAVPIIVPSKCQANPYPSAITVSGFTNGTITDVDLILNDVSHGIPADIDVLLSSSGGRRAFVMSDVGDNSSAAPDVDLTLDDEAAVSMPVHILSSGTFRPIDLNATDDTFAAPAPALGGEGRSGSTPGPGRCGRRRRASAR